jgi:flagellar basal body-associated protein FliL
MSEEKEAQQKPKSSKKSLIIGIIIGIVVFLIAGGVLAGFGIYNFVIVPGQVADSANKNIDILNKNTTKGTQVLNDLSNNLNSASSNSSNSSKKVEQISSSKSDLESLVTSTTSDVDKLDKGPNEDTKQFYQNSKDALIKRKETFGLMIKVVDNLACITQKTSDFSTFLDNSNKELAKINTQDLATYSDYSRKSADEVDKAAKALVDLKTCFVGDLSKYYTSDIETDIQKDNKLYTDYANTLREFATAVEQKDSNKIDTVSKKLDQVSAEPTSVLKNKNLDKAFTEPAKSIDAALSDLKDQEKKLDQNLKDLKAKYRI